MKSDKYIPGPADEGIAASQATEADVAHVEDATFQEGVNVPAASRVTTYLHLKKHFG
jgi:hypothetical protein